ncbi:MAG TPA: agmatine deiminase family protein [Dongiaceae bacterium]|nr:agmatine deiminase family protein [Dongiaceae bacterium]
MSRPADDGFSLPGAWVTHARCWLAWPTRAETWGEHLDAARETYSEVAKAIARFEPVTFIAKPKNVAEVSLSTGAGVATFSMPHDDSFLYDMGPSFVVDAQGNVAGVDWLWNAWGGSYPDHERDAAVAEKLLEHLGMRRYLAPLVLEGGAIEGDGEGTLLASEPVLLNPNRNPNLGRAEIERHLEGFLGVRKIIWLAGGLAGDPAGGLIDNAVCYARPGVVLALTTSDTADPNYAALQDNLQRLRSATDAQGRSLEVIEIEQPRSSLAEDGRRLPLSYTSLYLANGAAIVPAFEDPQDSKAYEVLLKVFAGREVVQLPARELGYGGAGLRAIAVGQPAGPPAA